MSTVEFRTDTFDREVIEFKSYLPFQVTGLQRRCYVYGARRVSPGGRAHACRWAGPERADECPSEITSDSWTGAALPRTRSSAAAVFEVREAGETGRETKLEGDGPATSPTPRPGRTRARTRGRRRSTRTGPRAPPTGRGGGGARAGVTGTTDPTLARGRTHPWGTALGPPATARPARAGAPVPRTGRRSTPCFGPHRQTRPGWGEPRRETMAPTRTWDPSVASVAGAAPDGRL